jgi:hypothetical protein
MLGLNERIKVEIPTIEKLKKIVNKDIIKDTEDRLRDGGKKTPNGYTHFYNYKTDSEGNILIKDVYSYGGAKVYNEIKQLLVKGEIKLALRVLNSIKKATSLSTATKDIATNPTESHDAIIKLIENRGIQHNVIEESIGYKAEGWVRITPTAEEKEQARKNGYESYIWLEKDKDRLPIKELAENSRLKDPVVLQTTVVKVL